MRGRTPEKTLAGLRGFLGLLGIVTLPINRRDFAARRAQIRGELSAVMDGVAQTEIQERNGGHLERAAKIQHFGGLLTGESRKPFKIFGERGFVPLGDIRGRDAALGPRDRVEVEDAGR